MTQRATGNTRNLKPSQIRAVERLFRRRIDADEIGTLDLFREIYETSKELSRRVGVLVSREGRVEEVVIGTREILYLPDLGRYRLGAGRLRRLRLLFADLAANRTEATIPQDIYTDLEKLRLDMVVAIREVRGTIQLKYAHLQFDGRETVSTTVFVPDAGQLDVDFSDLMNSVERDLAAVTDRSRRGSGEGAVLVGVYDRSVSDATSRIEELRALAQTAGLIVKDIVIQRQPPNPKTLLGKGKLEELVLHCLRLDADLLVFDSELRPSQWRAITNSSELKVIDRSMLILDIFAQRASSSEGRIQVELAQLKYNMPRLVELDAGLSRLTGGIGGRGPGETKLEIGRRRARERVTRLERELEEVAKHRNRQRQRMRDSKVPLVAVLGYTNVGKSTLLNKLTGSSVLTENKLFATLEPTKRRLTLSAWSFVNPVQSEVPDGTDGLRTASEEGAFSTETSTVLLSDTVGFIRELPEELKAAFKATLEELYEANTLLHVIDGSDPAVYEQKEAVERVLEEMSLAEKPCKVVVNKVDAADPEVIAALVTEFDAIPVSCVTGAGLTELRKYLWERFRENG